MPVAKQLADLITASRAVLAFYLAWLGVTHREAALPLAVWLMIANWTGDSLDGVLARRSRLRYDTWVGDHDLEIDILVSLGLLVYMLAAGLVNLLPVGLYLLIWAFVIAHWGFHRSFGLLFQAPIFAWFILTAILLTPQGWWLVLWIIVAVVLTWPRFPQEVIPDFMKGFKAAIGASQN